jgi:hypothetical protein
VASSIRLAFEIEGLMVDEVRGRAAEIIKNALSAAVAAGTSPHRLDGSSA